MKKRILSLILALVMLIGLVPEMSIHASAEVTNYNVYVGGTQITSANAADVFGNGTVSYNDDIKTLTLNGYSNNGAKYGFSGIIYAQNQNLIIKLKGENTLTGDKCWGIRVSAGNLTICDDTSDSSVGSLSMKITNATDKSGGIYNNGALTIENVNISIDSEGWSEGIYISSTDDAAIINCTLDIVALAANAISNPNCEMAISDSNITTKTQFSGFNNCRVALTNTSIEATSIDSTAFFGCTPTFTEGVEKYKVYAGETAGTATEADVSAAATYTENKYVKIVPPIRYTVTANPTEGGTVTGGDTYNHGASVMLTATPDAGYRFVNWTESDVEVSTENPYSFIVTENRNLVANFRHEHKLCQANSCTLDHNGDGQGNDHGGVEFAKKVTTRDELQAAATTGGNVYLANDINVDETITVAENKTLNICLNGKNIYYKVTGGSVFKVSAKATLNITDCHVGGDNGIDRTTGDNYNGIINNGTVTIYGGKITGSGFDVTTYGNQTVAGGTVHSTNNSGIGNADTGNAYINGGTVTGNDYGIKNGGFYNGNGIFVDGGTVIVSGGEVIRIYNSTGSHEVTVSGGTVTYILNRATLNISSGTVNGIKNEASGTVTITGGNITSTSGTAIDNTGTLYLSGNPTITGAGGTSIYTNQPFTVTGALTGENNSIVVNMSGTGVLVTNGAPYISIFKPRYTSTQKIVADGNDLKMVEPSITVTANANPAEGGTVTGAGTYDYDASVTLKATAQTGYSFVNWTKNGDVVSTNAEYTFNAQETCTLEANFAPNSYTITLDQSGEGTVAVEAIAKFGETVTVTATPAEGYYLKDIRVVETNPMPRTSAGSVTDIGDGTYSFTMPAYDVCVEVVFAEYEYDIWVGGVQVTGANKDNLVKAINNAANTTIATGSVSFEPANNILTLNNFTLNGTSGCDAIYSAGISLTIKLIGENILTSDGAGVVTVQDANYENGNLTILGADDEASLTVTSADDEAIYADGELRIEDCDIKATTDCSDSFGINAGEITAHNAKIEGEGTWAGIVVHDDTSFTNCEVISKGDEEHSAGFVLFGYNQELLIKDSIFTAVGSNEGIFGNESSAGNKITISNSKVTAKGTNYNGIYVGVLEIIDSTVNSEASVWGVEAGVLTISGEKTLVTATAAGDECFGILVTDGDLTISGGTVTATATGDYCSGIFVEAGDFVISGGTVTAKAVGSGGMGIVADTLDISGGVIESCGDLVGITFMEYPTFEGNFGIYAGESAPGAFVTAPDDATYNNKYIKIIPAFTVKYMAGENEVHSETVAQGGNVKNVPPVPAKTGYTAAWSADGKNIISDTTIHAVYTVNQYTISFDTDGGSAIAAITQDYGTAVTAPAAPSKTGYTFSGWEAAIPATMPAENMTVKAKWTINRYTVTYKADGEVVKTLTVEHGKDATAPEIPAKVGYTAAWDKDGKNITADTEINAVYTVKKYTVTYEVDGEVVDTVEVEHGQDATAPEIPAKTGYTGAWSADGKNITADTEINAVYTVKKYTVTYKVDGEVVDTVEVEHGKDATAPEIPAKTGHTAAWDKDGKNITADTEINAVYTVKKYTVTYKADGKVVKTVEVEHGKDATAPEIPAKEGYNETTPKWDKDGKNITADTEINAVYTKNQPGEYADVTPDTNVGGGKVAEEIEELKEKVPFTQEEEKQIEHGADVEVWLEIKDISDSVSSEEKAKVEEKLGDADVALYLDIAMFKQVGENEASRLTQLSDKVQITFKLDDSYINTDKDVTRTYSIIHVHDGKAEVITPVFDANAKTLSFQTDRFSTYALVYTDVVNTPPTEDTVPPTEETVPPTEKPAPPAEIPATGDSFQPAFWIACMTLSIFGIAVLLLDTKRRHAR